MSETSAETPPPPAPASKSKLVPLLLVLNTGFGGGVMFLVMKRPPTAAASAAGAEGKHAKAEGHEGGGEGEGEGEGEGAGGGQMPGPIVKLDSFVIQLRTVDADRYARVAFDIEIAHESDRGAVAARLSQIRDAVIAYFSDRTLDELRGSEGMERTKVALLKRFDDIVPGRRVRSLFVTDFVIQ
jgi:flagellar FliL protein